MYVCVCIYITHKTHIETVARKTEVQTEPWVTCTVAPLEGSMSGGWKHKRHKDTEDKCQFNHFTFITIKWVIYV